MSWMDDSKDSMEGEAGCGRDGGLKKLERLAMEVNEIEM